MDVPDIEKLQCQADARYGSGANRLDVVLNVSSLALMVGTAGLSLSTKFLQTASNGISKARSLGVLSLRSTRILQLSTATLAVDSVIAYSQINKACFSEKTSYQSKVGNCSTKDLLQENNQESCILASALGTLSVFGTGWATNNELSKVLKFLADKRTVHASDVTESASTLNRAPAAKWTSSPDDLVPQQRFRQFEQTSIGKNNLNRDVTARGPYTDIYRDAIRRADPQIKTLVSLGARIKEEQLILPKAGTLYKNLNTKIDELVNSGTISENDVLRPVRAFVLKNGKRIYPQIGENIPKDATPFSDLIPPDEFARLVANGKFPIGEVMLSVRGGASSFGDTAFLHDLNHFGVFLDDPKIMAAFRNRFREIATKGIAKEPLVNWRANRLLEAGASANPNQRAEIVEALKSLDVYPKSPPKKFNFYSAYTPTQFAVVLKNKTPKELEQIASQLLEKSTQNISYWGGSLRDLPMRWDLTVYLDSPNSRRTDVEYLQGSLNAIAQGKGATEWQIQVLSRYMAMLDNSSQIQPATMIEEGLRNGTISKKSHIYDYYCRSEIFPKENFFRMAFCD
jgi:hypothetical protein